MSNQAEYSYDNIENPYNNSLERSSELLLSENDSVIGGTPAVQDDGAVGQGAVGGQSFDNMWITNWIKSKNYQPKTRGFMIDGRTGSIECMDLYASGSIIGSSLHIPDEVTPNSFHTDSSGNSWWGCNLASFNADPNNAAAYIMNTGSAKFDTVTIAGRAGTALATAINASANLITDLINARLDTSSKMILSDFDFGSTNYAGAVKAGDIAWNTTTGAVTGGSGVVVYRKGIVGANGGSVTFSIDATTGNATFSGAISGSSVTGTTITGGTIQTSASGQRVMMYNDKIEIYNSLNALVGTFQGLSGTYASGIQVNIAEINVIALEDGGASSTVGTGKDGLVVVDTGDLYLSTRKADNTGGHVSLKPGVGSQIVCYEDIRPSSDGGYDLGTSSYGWNYLYLGTAGRYLYDNGGTLYFNGSPVGSSGTVTSVATGTGLTGGTITTSGTISHLTSSGYKHVPSGGASDQYLRYSSDGTAYWSYLGGSNCSSLIPSSSTVYLGNSSYYWDYAYIGAVYTDDFYERSQGYIDCHTDFKPYSNGSYNLGASSYWWSRVYTNTIDNLTLNTNNILSYSTSYINVYCDLNPVSNSVYDLGSSSYYWDSVYTQKVYFQTGYASNPNSSGQIVYYDGSLTKGFRGYINGWTGQFDLTGV